MIRRFVEHVRSLWRGWGVLIVVPPTAWTIYCFASGEVRWELAALVVVVVFLATVNVATKRLLVGLYPLVMVALFYDMMRFFQSVFLSGIHDCDLRDLELTFFGFTSGGQRMTVHDWLQPRARLWLDIVCAIPYGTFIYASIAFAAFLYVKDYLGLRRYAWTFFALNVAGFLTHHIYPAAPPWYFHTHGCAVDIATKASEGPNLMRVDTAIGFGYFRGFYGRSKDIFGAMPSLHVTYPLLIVLEGWRNFRAPMRVLSVMFFVSMVFAAVYLDHHWILDVIAGIAYALAAHGAMRLVFARLARARDGAQPATEV